MLVIWQNVVTWLLSASSLGVSLWVAWTSSKTQRIVSGTASQVKAIDDALEVLRKDMARFYLSMSGNNPQEVYGSVLTSFEILAINPLADDHLRAKAAEVRRIILGSIPPSAWTIYGTGGRPPDPVGNFEVAMGELADEYGRVVEKQHARRKKLVK
ncbi:MAG: hypothetical protein ABF489_05755 [Bifidobacterium sp.]|uniref:hypothetical protein n=1 Tax=Bifidobacterium sp. TaxID=41200 RepID=UPI0039E76AEB